MPKIIALIIFLSSSLFAKELIRVGLEPFPPFIVSAQEGITIDLLKKIEKVSNYKFKIEVMNYARAKHGLKEGKLDLIGHTPYGLEPKEFYKYAQELNIKLPCDIDFYSHSKKLMKIELLKSSKKVGIPTGNEEFISESFDLNINNLMHGKLPNLLKMLNAKRIDYVVFDRSSIMYYLEELSIKNIYYRKLSIVYASLAVRNNEKGTNLKEVLEKHFKDFNIQTIYKKTFSHSSMPSEGILD